MIGRSAIGVPFPVVADSVMLMPDGMIHHADDEMRLMTPGDNSLGTWLASRMRTAAILGAAYGIWLVAGRFPCELPRATWLAASAWAVAGFAGLAMVVLGAIWLLGWLAGRLAPGKWRAISAAVVTTGLFVPFILWLVLGEFLYSCTGEVVGIESLLLLWYNTGAVLQNAWQMAHWQLIGVVTTTLVSGVILFSVSRRSFARQFAASHQEPSCPVGKPAASASVRLKIYHWLAGLLLLVGAVDWQVHGTPSDALAVVCRCAPPLRAFHVLQRLVGTPFKSTTPIQFGSPLMTEEQYRAQMGTPISPPPNIIFLLMESTSARSLHCYGYSRDDISPHMDRLAAEGTLFEHCEAAASFSSLSLVSVGTSLYMLRGEVYDHFADADFPFMSLPHALKLAGYDLAMFSSANEAFDNVNHFNPPEDFAVYYTHDTAQTDQTDCMRADDKYAVSEFEKWIARRGKAGRPFYCGFYLQSSHFNYEVPEPWASHYLPVPPLYSNGDGILQIPLETLPLLRNQYDNSMRYADDWVGRIRAALEQAGVFENSIVVLLGDHGEAFMEHGLARHGIHVWEEMIHIPLLIRVGSQVRAAVRYPLPSRISETVSSLDVAPTITALVGIAPHPSWQGVDAFDPNARTSDRAVFSMTQYTRWQETIVLDRLKYIYDLTDVGEQLFDLRTDPGEKHDLVPAYRELATVMRQLLAGWHCRQLEYYSAARCPLTCYIGPYELDPALLNRFHELRAQLPRPQE